ncbi:MAG: T9SS type A sorting domain-containing protein [Chitinophagales bacterium]|nr:T9SS type A sorting domain-containing protein [Chitinophagales bacterium]
MKHQQLLFGTLILIIIFSAALLPFQQPAKAFHTERELALLHQLLLDPVDSSIIFPTASTCSGCHGFDSNYNALVDFFGNDVNMYDDWRATMMANSAKDPFWRAKVSHELLSTPVSFHNDIQTKCTSCHAPMGHYTALYRGHEHYTIADMLQDTIGLDGVSCASCHKIAPEQIGELHSGNINFDTNRVIYGPYPLPFLGPMAEFVGFEPVQGDHITDAGLCASCHTLLTEPIGQDGELLGTTFVEQATYHEWLNSAYETDNVSCQECHLPQLEESIVISSNYLFLEGRSPYGLHEMTGANTFMLELMKNYREELDINALPEHYDETIDATYVMLQEKSLDMEMHWMGVEEDTARFQLKLTNKAGHKFPSGYPSRRLFIELLLTTETGDTLFHSGAMNEDYTLKGETEDVEPHYDIINSSDQVQIYELAAGDENEEFTVVLEHAYVQLKDNRLPPLGFKIDDPVYDTTRIVGLAIEDNNFNYEEGVEGSGSDRLAYHIPTLGYNGPIEVRARAYYHSLPPRWVNPIFEESSAEIDTFKSMFFSIDNAPVLVAEISEDSIIFPLINAVAVADEKEVQIFPNPSIDGKVFVQSSKPIKAIHLYDVNGNKVSINHSAEVVVQLPASGVYLLLIEFKDGSRRIEKVLAL